MKNLILATVFAAGLVASVEAQEAAVSQADIQAIIQRLNKLEAENKAQAKKIAQLEGANKKLVAAQSAEAEKPAAVKTEETTQVSESGRVFTTESGKKYYLADKMAGIFEPLTESGLQFQPYGYLVLEGVWNSDYTAVPMCTDWVEQKTPNHGGNTSTLSVNDSILGFNIATPETYNGWKFNGKFEFDLVDNNSNDFAGNFHVRHLFWNMEHETGWSILFGQTWHLWKMVTPNEIDGAWMENAGHPYRRSPQIRVTRKWDWDDSSLEARVGFVKGGPGMGNDRDHDGVDDNEQSNWGLFEGAVVYDRKAMWEEGDRRWLVGLGGMYGRDKSRRMTSTAPFTFDGQEDEYDSDMIMVAGKVPFLDKFTLTGQLFAGENLAGVQGGIGQGVCFDNLSEKGREVSTVGGFVDLRYDLNDTWAFAAGYGFDDPTDSETVGVNWDSRAPGGRTFNSRTYVDAFYQFNANLHFGAEYAYLTTDYVDDNSADDHRLQFTVYYDF